MKKLKKKTIQTMPTSGSKLMLFIEFFQLKPSENVCKLILVQILAKRKLSIRIVYLKRSECILIENEYVCIFFTTRKVNYEYEKIKFTMEIFEAQKYKMHSFDKFKYQNYISQERAVKRGKICK